MGQFIVEQCPTFTFSQRKNLFWSEALGILGALTNLVYEVEELESREVKG